MTTVELTEADGAQLDAIGADGPVQSIRIDRLHSATPEQVTALWSRVAPSLEQLTLHVDRSWLEVPGLDLALAPRLRQLSLTRFRVPPAVLAMPALEALSLRECFVGGSIEPISELRVGPVLRSLKLVDCNFYIEHLLVEGEHFCEFTLFQDEDAAEHSFDRITFRAPKLHLVQHKAEWPTGIHFEGAFPDLKPSRIWIQAGNYSKPTVDVSATPEGHPLRSAPFQRK